ncbi:MAG TPA: DUF4397 domain-containing protein [Gemmatimonadaceae bacterium]
MKTVGVFTSVVAVATLLTACRDAQTDKEVTTRTSGGDAAVSISGDSADKRGVALVRVVNAVPGQARLIVRADRDHQLTAAEYKTVTDYQPIDRNWVTFEIGTSGDSAYTPLATNREMLTDGHRYTIVVMRDSAKNYETRVLRDEISDDTTAARLRVVHAARGVDEVNVVQRGADTLMDGVNFASEGGYKTVGPWTGTVEIRSESGNRLLLAIPNVSFEKGRSYTIVLTRNAAGKLESFRFDDSQVK